jgi:hypothetical protein
MFPKVGGAEEAGAYRLVVNIEAHEDVGVSADTCATVTLHQISED